MKPPAVVYLCSVWWWVATLPPPAAATRDCMAPEAMTTALSAKTNERGWPVLVAFKVTDMMDVQLQLSLSQSHHTHTNLTFTYKDKQNGVLQLEVVVESEVTPHTTTFLVLVTPDSWNTLKMNLHRSKLAVVVAGQSTTVNYTTRALIDFPRHRSIDTVTSSCPSTCLIDVDLQCLYDADVVSEKPGTKVESKNHSTQGSPSWPFYLVLVLLVLAILLFLAWRYQRKQIKKQLHLQAEAEATRRRISLGGDPEQRRKSNQEARNWDEVRWVNDRTQYSTVLIGYDGPCTGDD